MDRQIIVDRLNESIEKKEPIIGVCIGNGRSAQQAAQGGADILAALNAGRFRMSGFPSIASTLPFENCNEVVLDFASKEVVPRAENVPVLFGACAQDPRYGKEQLLEIITNRGFSGVINFPTVSIIDGQFREALEESGEGFNHEVELLHMASKRGLFTVGFVVTMDEAIKMVQAGVDVLCLHFGWTYINTQSENESEPHIDQLIHKTRLIFDEIKKYNPKIIPMIYGGTFVANQKVIKRFYEETSTIGYFGGSVFDTFPTSGSISEATSGFKSMNRLSLLEKENKRLKTLLQKKDGVKTVLGDSKVMQDMVDWIEKVSNHDANILLEGEIGTGKDLVAKAIHYNSNRAMHPFRKVNCASIAGNYAASTLFGYERGAFIGAEERKLGIFENANHGTVFLDNVSELEPDIQSKLLRVIQDGDFERGGGNETVTINVRIVSSSTVNLKNEMLNGKFREDIYYLLTVLYRYLPSLKEHKEDIPIYVSTFLNQISERHNIDVSIGDNVMNSFMSYNWPGNVRELKNVLERGVIMSENGTLDTTCLPIGFREYIKLDENVNYIKNSSMIVEKEMILNELMKTNWNQTKVASKLGITRRTLYNKLKKYKINKENYKL